MSSLTEFVSTIIGMIRIVDVPYVVTGSYASIAYSEPRTTMDIDLVVHASYPEIEAFRSEMIRLGYHVPTITPETDMFNVLDIESSWKADIILWQDEPFEKERFARRVLVELLPGVDAYIPTVEDMILAKLRWIKGRESAIQMWDVTSMIETNRKTLDREYLQTWAKVLDVTDSLVTALRESVPPDS